MTKKYCDICGEEIDGNAVTTGWHEYSLAMKSWSSVITTYDVCQCCGEMFVNAILEMRKQKGVDDE